MHEVGLMQQAVEIAIAHGRAGGADRISRIRLKVGALSGAMPDALRFAFDVTTEGTMAEGAQLQIDTVDPQYRCVSCGELYWRRASACERCEGELKAESGYDLQVASIEVV